MPSVISTDVLIVGAGVAGLWLNARLRRQGFSTVLVESATLGGGAKREVPGDHSRRCEIRPARRPHRRLRSHCRHAAPLA